MTVILVFQCIDQLQSIAKDPFLVKYLSNS